MAQRAPAATDLTIDEFMVLDTPEGKAELVRPRHGVVVANLTVLLSQHCARWRLPAYMVRRAARLRKRSKFYWNDPALALHVAGETEPTGMHLETLVFTDLRAGATLESDRPSIMYWRDEADREVDFVVERAGRTLATKSRPRPVLDITTGST